MIPSSRVVLRLAVCAVLVAGALTGSAAPVSAACETIYVDAYDVELEIPRKVYRVGETARIEATVTRKDTGAPVSAADFFAVLFFEHTIVVDVDKTDVAGAAVATLRLRKKDVEVGPVPLLARAETQLADAQCAAVVEYGDKRLRKAFRIER